MSSKVEDKIRSSDITDYKVYLTRRNFVRGAALAASATATTLLYRKLNPPPEELPKGQKIETVTATAPGDLAKSGFTVNEWRWEVVSISA